MRWNIPRSILTALILMAVATTPLFGQEAPEEPPCVLVWSAPPTEAGVTSYIFELRRISRAILAMEDEETGEYLMFGGPGAEKNGMVCFDVDGVQGNPAPNAQTILMFMGETYCYLRLEDGSLQTNDGVVYTPDREATDEAYNELREVCEAKPEVTPWRS